MQPGESITFRASHPAKSVYFMLLTIVALWGVNVVMVKYLTAFFPPLALSAIRIPIAVSFLVPVAIYRHGWVKIPRTAWPSLMGTALFSIYLHQLTLAWGLAATSGTHTSLILGLNPLFTTILASCFAKELLSARKFISIIFGFGAILLIVSQGSAGSASTLTGDIVILISTLTAAVGYLFIKQAATHLPILVLTSYSHALASAGLIITACLLEPSWLKVQSLSFNPIAVLLFSGWVNTGLGALWWNTGIHLAGASTTSLFLNGVPVFGMLTSALVLSEMLSWQHYAALMLVIVGVSLGTGAIPLPSPLGTEKKGN